jgi:hypothetical protein
LRAKNPKGEKAMLERGCNKPPIFLAKSRAHSIGEKLFDSSKIKSHI